MVPDEQFLGWLHRVVARSGEAQTLVAVDPDEDDEYECDPDLSPPTELHPGPDCACEMCVQDFDME